MQIKKMYKGYCPIQQREVALPITYVNNSPLSEPRFEKGTSDCSLSRIPGKCNIECPILKNAPRIIKK